MPSPQWTESGTPLLAAAIAAAVHHAWHQPERDRSRSFHEALRKALGPETYERVQRIAHDVFLLQEAAPVAAAELPPPWAWFEVCPGCMSLRRTRFTVPQNGRTKLQVLRDAGWLAAQVENGRTTPQIAKQLDCTPSLVGDWLRKHGLATEKTLRHEEIDATVRRMYAEKEGPGTTAKALGRGMTADRVREVLRRLGLANKKHGQVYYEREWWRVRLQDQEKSILQCAREAGVRPHNASYWVKKFGLSAHRKKRTVKYPILADRNTLRELLLRHGHNYESAAREVGCAPSLVSRYARDLLGIEKRHENHVPHSDRAWWVERLDAGATTYELAEEAGIEEKTAREKCRVFDLLPQAYRNNANRERARRRSA